jgi:di/tripeptidase
MILPRLLAAAAVFALLYAPAQAADADKAVQKILASKGYKVAVQTLSDTHDQTVADLITLTEIPAPPFKEAERGKAYLAMLKAAGLADVETDAEGNVMGLRRGTAHVDGGPVVVFAAHLDTVFPEGTDVKVRREGTKLMAPGIGDDTRSLATLLAYLRAMDAGRIKTKADILFVGNVGEEGAGDLRGVRYLFNKGKYAGRIKAFISMDGADPRFVVNQGVGSKRYNINFHGPGGHSYGAYGIVNPMSAMGRTVTDLYAITTPTEPKTTYAASVVGGGTSVNAIPHDVFLQVDLRSESAAELARLDKQLNDIMANAVASENKARSTRFGPVTYEAKVIGERPTGRTDESAAIVKFTHAASKALGFETSFEASSTDSNMPMSLGIPAVTIGSGGAAGRAHTLDEWVDVEKASSLKGMQVGLVSLLALAGVE